MYNYALKSDTMFKEALIKSFHDPLSDEFSSVGNDGFAFNQRFLKTAVREVIMQEKNNHDEIKQEEASELERARLIEETGQVTSSNSKHLIHCLTIIGQVEGHYILPPQNKTTKYERS